MIKNSKYSLNNLFQNNKFLLVISLLISVSIWFYMSIGSSNDTTITISNIPIQIELSDKAIDNGLMIFSGSEQTASVTVTGNRAVLGSISEKDITVTAAANGIDSSGSYQLSVSAIKTNPGANFQIISTVTPSTVNVVVDYLREASFPIQENVVYKVAEGYYASTSLSAKEIMISGPQTKITKIAKASAVATINGILSNTATTESEIILYDEINQTISTDLLTMEFDTVEATITVLPEKTVSVKPVFVNKPDGLVITDDMITIEPSSILLAGPKDILENTASVNLQSIDFSTLINDVAVFPSLGIDIPADCRNISNSTAAKVTLDLSTMSNKSVAVSKFSVKGLSSEYKADVTQKSVTVSVIGPPEQLKTLKSEDITCVIDTSDVKGTIGSVQMPVTFEITGADSCWVAGSYKVNVTISEK